MDEKETLKEQYKSALERSRTAVERSQETELTKEQAAELQKEMETLQKELQTAGDRLWAQGVYPHTLKKKFQYTGQEYDTVFFDFGKLTGADDAVIVEELEANGVRAIVPELSVEYQSLVAVRASGVAADALSAMPIREYLKITDAVQTYLLEARKSPEVSMELDKLTGADAQAIEQELLDAGHRTSRAAFDAEFQRRAAERAGGPNKKTLDAMPLRDCLWVRRQVRNFLAG